MSHSCEFQSPHFFFFFLLQCYSASLLFDIKIGLETDQEWYFTKLPFWLVPSNSQISMYWKKKYNFVFPIVPKGICRPPKKKNGDSHISRKQQRILIQSGKWNAAEALWEAPHVFRSSFSVFSLHVLEKSFMWRAATSLLKSTYFWQKENH